MEHSEVATHKPEVRDCVWFGPMHNEEVKVFPTAFTSVTQQPFFDEAGSRKPHIEIHALLVGSAAPGSNNAVASRAAHQPWLHERLVECCLGYLVFSITFPVWAVCISGRRIVGRFHADCLSLFTWVCSEELVSLAESSLEPQPGTTDILIQSKL